jgi:hypothetical protein
MKEDTARAKVLGELSKQIVGKYIDRGMVFSEQSENEQTRMERFITTILVVI